MNSPIYVTGINSEGQNLLGGIYRMKDEVGFPIELSILSARDKGCEIDWCELLVDAGRQKDPNKFIDAVEEMEIIKEKV